MIVCFDHETFPIRKGLKIPQWVCAAWKVQGSDPVLTKDPREFLEHFKHWAATGARIVAHNASFDMGVTLGLAIEQRDAEAAQAVWDAYSFGLVSDTVIRGKLLDLAARGLDPQGYSLAHMSKKYLGVDLTSLKSGPDAWRLRYNELHPFPLEDWPQSAKDYPLSDVTHTLALWELQAMAPPVTVGTHEAPMVRRGIVRGETFQVKADWALHLTSCTGIRTDPVAIGNLTRDLEDEVARMDHELQGLGLLRGDGTKDQGSVRTSVIQAYRDLGLHPPMTDKGNVKTSSDAIEDLAGSHPGLDLLVRRDKAKKRLTDFAYKLQDGISHALCPSYDVLKESGRTSSYNPNIQQIPRKGGLRECVVPRQGNVFIACDYDSAELRAWAEVCEIVLKGRTISVLAHKYREDPDFDPHTYFASQVVGIPYHRALEFKSQKDPQILEARQLGKVANFGYPGGMGATTLVSYARGYGLEISPTQAQALRRTWVRTWSEAEPYLNTVSALMGNRRTVTMVQLVSQRIRARCTFCAACNTWFQGLVADGAKAALTQVVLECYTGTSPLRGFRPVAFIHDEIILEGPEERASAATDRLREVMISEMSRYIRSVPVTVGASLSRVWSKDAQSTRGPEGLWTIWEKK